MFDYMSRSHETNNQVSKKPYVDDENALFSLDMHEFVAPEVEDELDKQIDHLVDNRLPYDDARRSLGLEERAYHTPVTAHDTESVNEVDIDRNPGVALDLGKRAAAFSSVMKAFSKQNRTSGAVETVRKPNSDFHKRYQDPYDAVDRMVDKNKVEERHYERAIDDLNQTYEMRRGGFSDERVDETRFIIRSLLLSRYGPGNSFAADRHKAERKTNATARRAHKI
jgi:hypothetical protein